MTEVLQSHEHYEPCTYYTMNHVHINNAMFIEVVYSANPHHGAISVYVCSAENYGDITICIHHQADKVLINLL